MEFRGKTYHFLNHYYVCDESGEEFTDEATGEINFAQVYNQYREDCQLSKADKGRLLGFGENQFYRYELGEVPSPSNGRLMRRSLILHSCIELFPCKENYLLYILS